MSLDNKISPAEVLKILLEERPMFHGRENAGSKNFAIQSEILEWMIGNLPAGAHTLETGCGYSTVILATLSGKHTAIAPFPEEHILIKAWCSEHGIGTDHITFIAEPSQNVIHNLGKDELDFVLIDGDHAFPAPFIDWYYTADRIKVGG